MAPPGGPALYHDAPISRENRMTDQPLRSLDDWEDFLEARYPAETGTAAAPSTFAGAGKKAEAFRDYKADARPGVREFYKLNHRHQTLDFVLSKKNEYLPLRKRRMGIW